MRPAGILLGPSLLGWLWPSASDALFTHDQRGTISALSQIGLTVFMFVVGAEFDINAIRGRRKTVVAVGHAGIAVPFAFAVVLSFLLYPNPDDLRCFSVRCDTAERFTRCA